MTISDLLKNADNAKLKEWISIVENYLCKLSESDYSDLFDDTYEIINGEVLSSEKAEKLVKSMKPYGQHYHLDDIEKYLPSSKYKDSTKYYVLNMMYNDYHQMFGEDDEKYIEISKLWLDDVDADGGDIKTYRYATRV